MTASRNRGRILASRACNSMLDIVIVFILSSFSTAQDFPDRAGILPHVQNRCHSDDIIFDVVVDGKGEPLRIQFEQSPVFAVGSRVESQRGNVRHQAVDEVIPGAKLARIVELSSSLKIFSSAV